MYTHRLMGGLFLSFVLLSQAGAEPSCPSEQPSLKNTVDQSWGAWSVLGSYLAYGASIGKQKPFVDCPGFQRIQTDDANPLRLYVHENEDTEAHGVLVIFHGNNHTACEEISDDFRVYNTFRHIPFKAIVVPEYPGFSESFKVNKHNVPRESTIRPNLERVAAWLDSFHEEEAVTFVGHSFGTATAIYTATQLRVEDRLERIILYAPFTSLPDVAREITKTSTFSGLFKGHSYQSLAWSQFLPEVQVTVVHGTRDLVVPYSLGQTYAQCLGSRGELLTVEGGGHDNLIERSADEVARRLR